MSIEQRPEDVIDDRAQRRQSAAIDLVNGNDQDPLTAIVYALLAIEARIEELTLYMSRGGLG